MFSIPLPNGSLGYGRILLDVFRIRRQQVFDPRCALNDIYGSGLLVQLYRFTTTSPLTDIEGLNEVETFLDEFLAHDLILNGEHSIIGHLPVAPADIDFPEYVSSHRPAPGEWHFYFEKGGVVAELASGWRARLRGVFRDVDHDAALKLPRGSFGQGINADLLLRHIQSPTGINDRAREDLRASPHRKRVLRLAGLSPTMTYDQMATPTKAPRALELLEMR